MKLRYQIFILVTSLGLLPLAILLATSLPQGLHQLDNAAQQETIARSQIRYARLSARVNCLKKSIIRLAAVPAARDLITNQTAIDYSRVNQFTFDWFKNDEQIQTIQVVDILGNELLRMTRQHKHLGLDEADQLGTIEQSPPFLHGLQLLEGAVFVGISQQETGESNVQNHSLFMVTPITSQSGELLGMTILTVDLASFLHDFLDSFWLAPDLSPLNDSKDIPPTAIPAQLHDRSLLNTEIIITTGADRGNQMGWLPLAFNPDHRPILWIGSPVDMTKSLQLRQDITRNIIIIVSIGCLFIFGMAHFIASHVQKIKAEIVRGLQHILHRNKPFTFAWQGPEELQHLAFDLTCVGENYVLAQTQKQQAETALHESEENFRSLTSAALDGIIMMNKQGKITFWNTAATTFFGYSATEAIGQPVHTLICPKRQETGEDLWADNATLPSQNLIPLTASCKDGSTIQVELSLSSASLSEEWHAIWIIRDISERLKNEKQAMEQQQQLIQADKMISLGLLVAGVAHEINNPNSIILLNTPHLQRAWQSALPILDEFKHDNGDFRLGGVAYSEMKELIPKLISDIEDGGLRIKQIVSDLKDYARQDTDHRFEPINLNDVVAAALRLTGNKVKKATNHLLVNLAPTLPPISGNNGRLEQVAINLINNSCESLANPQKKITITTSFDSDLNLVQLTIEDDGCGIDTQAITKITDPFYTSKRSLGGTGLGLSVSAGIIKEHGGTLKFSSATGHGTTATITFPPLATR